MHQSILAPLTLWLTPGNLQFFSYGWQIARGRGHLSCQMPGGRDETRGQMPRYNESNAAGCETRQFNAFSEFQIMLY